LTSISGALLLKLFQGHIELSLCNNWSFWW